MSLFGYKTTKYKTVRGIQGFSVGHDMLDEYEHHRRRINFSSHGNMKYALPQIKRMRNTLARRYSYGRISGDGVEKNTWKVDSKIQHEPGGAQANIDLQKVLIWGPRLTTKIHSSSGWKKYAAAHVPQDESLADNVFYNQENAKINLIISYIGLYSNIDIYTHPITGITTVKGNVHVTGYKEDPTQLSIDSSSPDTRTDDIEFSFKVSEVTMTGSTATFKLNYTKKDCEYYQRSMVTPRTTKYMTGPATTDGSSVMSDDFNQFKNQVSRMIDHPVLGAGKTIQSLSDAEYTQANFVKKTMTVTNPNLVVTTPLFYNHANLKYNVYTEDNPITITGDMILPKRFISNSVYAADPNLLLRSKIKGTNDEVNSVGTTEHPLEFQVSVKQASKLVEDNDMAKDAIDDMGLDIDGIEQMIKTNSIKDAWVGPCIDFNSTQGSGVQSMMMYNFIGKLTEGREICRSHTDTANTSYFVNLAHNDRLIYDLVLTQQEIPRSHPDYRYYMRTVFPTTYEIEVESILTNAEKHTPELQSAHDALCQDNGDLARIIGGHPVYTNKDMFDYIHNGYKANPDDWMYAKAYAACPQTLNETLDNTKDKMTLIVSSLTDDNDKLLEAAGQKVIQKGIVAFKVIHKKEKHNFRRDYGFVKATGKSGRVFKINADGSLTSRYIRVNQIRYYDNGVGVTTQVVENDNLHIPLPYGVLESLTTNEVMSIYGNLISVNLYTSQTYAIHWTKQTIGKIIVQILLIVVTVVISFFLGPQTGMSFYQYAVASMQTIMIATVVTHFVTKILTAIGKALDINIGELIAVIEFVYHIYTGQYGKAGLDFLKVADHEVKKEMARERAEIARLGKEVEEYERELNQKKKSMEEEFSNHRTVEEVYANIRVGKLMSEDSVTGSQYLEAKSQAKYKTGASPSPLIDPQAQLRIGPWSTDSIYDFEQNMRKVPKFGDVTYQQDIDKH